MGHEFDPDRLLSRPLMAMLATLESDGAPRISPVWFLWEQGTLWMPGNAAGSAVRRLSADPRCAVEIVEFDNDAGILLHLGLRGRVTVEPMSAPRFRTLLTRYLGDKHSWNPWFIDNIARIDDPDGRMIRLCPDSIFTNNVSYFRTGPDLTPI